VAPCSIRKSFPSSGNTETDSIRRRVQVSFFSSYNFALLSLNVLNARWINSQFHTLTEGFRKLDEGSTGLSRRHDQIDAVRWILIETQHIPLKINPESRHELAQVIVNPEHMEIFQQLKNELSKTKRQATLSLYTQLGLVVVTQVLSIIQLFTAGGKDNAIGIGVAINSVWAWMFPITWGWVSVGTQTRAKSIRDALKAVKMDLVDDNGKNFRTGCNFIIDMTDEADVEEKTRFGFRIIGWEREPGPPFAFARFQSHMIVCETIRHAFNTLPRKQRDKTPVRGSESDWDEKNWQVNLTGTPSEMSRYIFDQKVEDPQNGIPLEDGHIPPSREDPENQCPLANSKPLPHDDTSDSMRNNVFIATMIGIILQWGTTGGAILIAYKTPVIGLGCDSGAYLLYGAASTVAWFLQVMSARTPYLTRCIRQNAALAVGNL